MPTGDQFGAVVFPVPTGQSPAGDPALGYLASYLQAAINAACRDMWGEVCARREPVAHVYTHDPKQLFDESRLPALYCWRGKSRRERVGDDLYRRLSEIHLAWINESAQDAHLIARAPAMNAIACAIDDALTSDRVTGWVVTGDTDPVAAIRGSSMSEACGFSRIQPLDDSPLEFTFQRIEEAAALPYYGFEMTCEVDEYQTKASTGVYPSKLNASASPNAAPSQIINLDANTPTWTPS